jgi:hypothetical protein
MDGAKRLTADISLIISEYLSGSENKVVGIHDGYM